MCENYFFSGICIHSCNKKYCISDFYDIKRNTWDLDLRDRDTIYHGQSGKIEYSNNFI